MIIYPLYIDPGTGSALFSITIGIAAAVYFLGRGFFLKIRVLLFRKQQQEQEQSQNKYVIYAEDKRYYGYFEPVLNEFESRQIDILYLTSSQDDPIFSSAYKHINGKYIGQGNKAYAYLNFLSAEFVLTTTPELDILQWKRSKRVKHYCHFIHAAGGPSLYRRFALDYFDSILLSSDKDIPEIRYLEKKRGITEKQLVVVGNSYFDRSIEKIKQIPQENEHIFTVLVSPSWGPSALLSIYGERLLDPLLQTEWRIIIRPHPQSLLSEKPMLDMLFDRYKDNQNIEWDYNHENIYSLSKSDVMISDFSGIIYDFVFLFERPVIVNIQDLDFRRLDAYNLEEKPYYLESLKKIGLEINKSNINLIKETILNLMQNKEFLKNQQKIKQSMWQYQGESGKRIVDFVLETVNRVTT